MGCLGSARQFLIALEGVLGKSLATQGHEVSTVIFDHVAGVRDWVCAIGRPAW